MYNTAGKISGSKMKRTGLPILVSFVAVCVVACGSSPIPGEDLPGDAVDRDELTIVDTIGDEGLDADVSRDISDSTDAGMDVEDIADGDVGDRDGLVDIDRPDVEDTVEHDGCVGPECQLACEDDGIDCTDEVRNNQGECESVLKTGFCLVEGVCYFTLQPDPENVCMFCDPEVSTSVFSAHSGLPCDDGNPCSAGDTCDAAGECQAGAGFGCDDGNECTIDRCDDLVGCTNTPYANVCNDNNACTYQDQCNAVTGECVGSPKNCNDNNICTLDSCDPVEGCTYEPSFAVCDDYLRCTVEDKCNADGVCEGTPVVCNDNNACTNDECLGGTCIFTFHYGSCDDKNACTDNDFCNGSHVCAGTPKVSCDDFNPCTNDSCDNTLGCVNTPNMDSCEPATACLVDGICMDGQCVGVPKDCEDGNLCTNDICNDMTGCAHIPTSGVCDDKNACTVNENCLTGACLAPAGPSGIVDCNDHNDCTVDNCNTATGCVYTPQGGECDDLNPCSLTGTGFCQNGECMSNLRNCDDNLPCTLDTCDGTGQCIHPPVIGACDDENYCTSNEVCVGSNCGGGIIADCNDRNVCTSDACNAAYGCVYSNAPGGCSDSDVCTVNDTCNAGVCVGTAKTCEDFNTCTDNHCNAVSGCYYSPNSTLCNDYNVCTYDDICGAGSCHGVSLFADPATKAGSLSYGKNGNSGQGVDVDDDQLTCSPKGSCVSGIDNAFSKLEWLFNPQLIKAVTDGSFAMLFEHEDLKTNGTPYELKMYYGARIDPVTCDPSTPGCNYGVFESSLRNGCEAQMIFDNAVISGTKLTAGGASYTVPIRIIFGMNRVPVALHRAKIKASVSLDAGKVVSGAGAIGGAVILSDLIAAVDAIPAGDFPAPYTKSIVLQYMNIYLIPDIDLDADGTDEAVSLGMPFALVTGHLMEPISE